MPDFITRWAAIAALCAAVAAFGWLQGAHHEQLKGARIEAATEALGKAQTARTAAITKKQTTITERANHEAIDLRRASDDYWRLRYPSADRRPVPGLPDPAGRTDAAPAPAAPGAAADPRAACDPADGSADAISLILLQRWVSDQAAANPPP